MVHSFFLMKEEWLNVNGLNICCYQAGTRGNPVVLLHGGGIDSALLSWKDTIGHLARKCRVYAPDLPGYGKSDKPATRYTTGYYVDFLENLLNALQLRKVTIVGLSLGGAVSLAFTLRYPAKVKRLVQVASTGFLKKWQEHALCWLLVNTPLNKISYQVFKNSRSLIRRSLLAGQIYHPERLSEELIDEVYEEARQPDTGRAFVSWQKNEFTVQGLRSCLIGKLQEINIPTLIINGAKDRIVPLVQAKRARRLMKDARLCIIPETRHWPQRERPSEVNQLLDDFLSEG